MGNVAIQLKNINNFNFSNLNFLKKKKKKYGKKIEKLGLIYDDIMRARHVYQVYL